MAHLRVARIEAARYRPRLYGDKPLAAFWPALESLMHQGIPVHGASLLSRPDLTADGTHIEFYSSLEGQPVSLDELSGEERAQASQVLQDRLDEAALLAGKKAGDPVYGEAAAALQQIVTSVRPEQVRIVRGQPVLVLWSHASLTEQPLAAPPPLPEPVAEPVPPAAEPPAAEPPVPEPVPTQPVAPPAPDSDRRRWLIPALLALLALLLVLLLLGFWYYLWPWLAGRHDDVSLDRLRAEREQLRKEQLQLEEELKLRLDLCTRGTPPPVVPPVQAPPVQPPPVQAAPPVKQGKACPPQSAPRQTLPEISVVLDASGSMRFPADFPEGKLNELSQGAANGDPAMRRELDAILAAPGPKRIDLARKALLDTVRHLPGSVAVNVVATQDCGSVKNFSLPAGQDRSGLGSFLDGIPANGGTPLAQALEQAASTMNGKTVPGIIVVVSDGDESCDGDPCAVARQLARDKPNLKINLVDVTGSKHAACIVEPGKGNLYSSRGGGDLPALVGEAAGQAPECPP